MSDKNDATYTGGSGFIQRISASEPLPLQAGVSSWANLDVDA